MPASPFLSQFVSIKGAWVAVSKHRREKTDANHIRIIVNTQDNNTDRRSVDKWRSPELTTTQAGIPIVIRPIRPEDKCRLAKLMNSLSSKSIYLRFFSPIREFSEQMLHRITHIDCRYEIVLIALDLEGNMLGNSTICILDDEKHAEFAVLVADEWQGQGIGAALLKRCLKLAKARGVEIVKGWVLSENTKMLALGNKLGFVRKQVPDGYEYELIINLSNRFELHKNLLEHGSMLPNG